MNLNEAKQLLKKQGYIVESKENTSPLEKLNDFLNKLHSKYNVGEGWRIRPSIHNSEEFFIYNNYIGEFCFTVAVTATSDMKSFETFVEYQFHIDNTKTEEDRKIFDIVTKLCEKFND